jgi:hypothetical protein
MEIEIRQYKPLKKNEAYIGTTITDFAYVHIFRTCKPKKEEDAIEGVMVIGEALSTEIFKILKEIDKQWRILNSKVTSIADNVPEEVGKLLKKIKEIAYNLEES